MLVAFLSGVAQAAQGQQYEVYEAPLPIASLNRDRLFNESAYGQALIAQLTERQQVLVAENDALQVELEEEEKELTERRKQVTAEEFAPLAAAFDEKVKRIRKEQGSKSARLAEDLDTARVSFFRGTEEVIKELMAERGIIYILDEQAVLLSSGEGDITSEALKRLDRLFASGALAVADP